MRIKYVKQEHKSGCAIACLAMITGTDYWETAKHFSVKAKSGVSTYKIRDYLGAAGFSLVVIKSSHYNQLKKSNARMKKLLLGPVNLVSVRTFANESATHAVVVDRKGKVYDPGPPSNAPHPRTLDDYFEIIEIIACFRDT